MSFEKLRALKSLQAKMALAFPTYIISFILLIRASHSHLRSTSWKQRL